MTQLVKTASDELTHVGRHGHKAVEWTLGLQMVSTRVADGVSMVNFCITNQNNYSSKKLTKTLNFLKSFR